MAQPRKEAEVWEACDILFEQGQALTYKNIWDTLEQLEYKRGSSSDIQKYLASWRQHRSQTKTSSQLPDTLAKSIAAVRQHLQSEADQKILAIETSCKEQVEEAQQQFIALEQKLHYTEQQRDHLQKLLTDLLAREQEEHHIKLKLVTQCQTLNQTVEQLQTTLVNKQKDYQRERQAQQREHQEIIRQQHQAAHHAAQVAQEQLRTLQHLHEQHADDLMLTLDHERTIVQSLKQDIQTQKQYFTQQTQTWHRHLEQAQEQLAAAQQNQDYQYTLSTLLTQQSNLLQQLIARVQSIQLNLKKFVLYSVKYFYKRHKRTRVSS